ncbi:protein-glutamate O-methyltransferase [Paracoccaceae bacterium Fryx2]|nr:protein-glutamate O-methyltransferase [Paracoccaceae bacterium Fryx2]
MTLRGNPVLDEGEARFTDADFAVIARLARADFGLHLTGSKKDLVYARLARRLRHLRLHSFRAYCDLLEGPGGAEERVHLLSALTTNVTHFFREAHHFQLLRGTVLPPLIKAARDGRRVRIWSAGCSAGQEPYSLAFTLLDLCPEAGRLDIRILASDADPAILRRAEAGVYPAEEMKALPVAARRLTDPAPNGAFAIAPKARALVRFGALNLMQAWPMRGPFDIIFCRNVAIYFDKDTQSRLWHRFAGLIPEGGHLFIGHSERVAGPAEAAFRGIGMTAYCKLAETGDQGGLPR